MGEQTEMMLDGTICYLCGVYIDDTGPEVPRYCDDCESEHGPLQLSEAPQ